VSGYRKSLLFDGDDVPYLNILSPFRYRRLKASHLPATSNDYCSALLFIRSFEIVDIRTNIAQLVGVRHLQIGRVCTRRPDLSWTALFTIPSRIAHEPIASREWVPILR
jgi:hypothetical protein